MCPLLAIHSITSTSAFLLHAKIGEMTLSSHPLGGIDGAVLPTMMAMAGFMIALALGKNFLEAVITPGENAKFDALAGVLTRGDFLNAAAEAGSEGGAIVLIGAECFERSDNPPAIETEAMDLLGGILSRGVPAGDLVGRLDLATFAVFLPSATLEQGVMVAEGIRCTVEDQCRSVAGNRVKLTVSIGVSASTSSLSLTALLKEASGRLAASRTPRPQPGLRHPGLPA